MTATLILGLDLGTTTAKASLFDLRGRRRALFRSPLTLRHLPDGGVEQDAEEFVLAARGLLGRVGRAAPARTILAAAGIACQRSTIVVWERRTGRPVGPAVSWMDRRAAKLVSRLSGHAGAVERRTGLRLSSHYGAAHLSRWFRADPALARSARAGKVVAGPVASFVLARLGDRADAACDPTLAQRTLLFDPYLGRWDPALCDLFGVPSACLPRVAPTVSRWGTLMVGDRAVPLRALAGDQQASAAAFELDGAKRSALAHFGTGAFVLWPARGGPRSTPGLLRSVRADRSRRFYVEGTVNTAGAALDVVSRWIGRSRLRAALRRVRSEPSEGRILLVPAFAGLGAPYWDDGARPLVVVRDAEATAGPGHLAQAALSGIAHRVADILEAGDRTLSPEADLIVSGPLTRLPALAHLVADFTGRRVRVANEAEATLLGIVRIAARASGSAPMPPARAGAAIMPRLTPDRRSKARDEWRRAVRASRAR